MLHHVYYISPRKMVVTQEEIERFQEDGAILLKQVLTPQEVQLLQAGIQKNLENPSVNAESIALEEGQGAYFNDYCNWRKIPEFREFVFNSAAGEIAAKVMNSKYAVFFHEHVLNKEPGTEKCTPWHHDQAYYPIDGWNMISLWIPVDPVPVQSTLRFVKGSHKWGWYHPRKFATESNYPVAVEPDIDTETDGAGEVGRVYQDVPHKDIEDGKYQILEWECEPGDVVVFHGKTLHGAGGNASSSSHRRVLSTRWVGEGTVFATRPWQGLMALFQKDCQGNFKCSFKLIE
ncbi:uncharacterized protein LOC111694894 isoform X3 [Eurytemora carolleeae]|uniref:uncharacterized protein LOC111694894 isoform X3 n=1 Tax=Eurytemora carolleeae TaxID=1294199 RepID=UPI000C7906EA|nr:uncharacterized protein LOC111694894 isoform X3 [Eurytemora carolleeae]|eukprot:XP_023319717.1 uncharacterized protein LOC111694894 isoform X3 [Eurytemora affinis]